MSALTIAAILFGLGALGGIALFGLRLRGGNPPIALAMVHGLAAAAGLVTLAVAVLGGGLGGLPLVSLILFGAATRLGCSPAPSVDGPRRARPIHELPRFNPRLRPPYRSPSCDSGPFRRYASEPQRVARTRSRLLGFARGPNASGRTA